MVTTPRLDTAAGIWLYRDWTIAAALLALGIGVFALVFAPEISVAVRTWDNPAYSHCWLVLPIAAYLAWGMRRPVMAVPLQPAPWIAVSAGIPIAALWFTAHRLGIME